MAAVLATVAGSARSYADATVAANASYTYSVRAYDAAGNISPASNTIPVATPRRPPPPAVGNVPPPPSGAFIGCYYSNITLSGSPSLVRTDPQINFDWGGNTPDRAVSRGGYSVRWQGNFTFAQDTYTFTALTSDGMRLYIDGQLVMDRWYNQTAIQSMLSRPVSAGSHLISGGVLRDHRMVGGPLDLAGRHHRNPDPVDRSKAFDPFIFRGARRCDRGTSFKSDLECEFRVPDQHR